MTKIRNNFIGIIGNSVQERVFFFTSFFILLILCALMIYNVWIQSIEDTGEEALKLATVAEAGFAADLVDALELNDKDLAKREYNEIRKSLREIVATDEDIRFAYIFKEKDGRMYFAADSEPITSQDYSPPGQEYLEATEDDWRPFRDGEPALVEGTDRWGSWVSVLVPMKKEYTGEVIAVFGIDYDMEMWYRTAVVYTAQTTAVAICIILLYLALISAVRKNKTIRLEIQDRIKAERILAERERSYAVLLSNLPGMAYRCKYDPEWTMEFVSEGCYELTGYSSAGLINNNEVSFTDLINPEYQSFLREKWNEANATRKKLAEEYEIKTAAGDIKWVFEQGQAIYSESGEVEALEGLIIDITYRKRKEEEAAYLNQHDFLTGIYNRRYLETAQAQMDSDECMPLTVMIGDINGVKLVNDAFGHAEGDLLIRETARIIEACSRENDVVARTGGDEFMILMPNTDGETANGIMERIKQKCEEYNQDISSEAYSLNVSLGFATKNTMEENLQAIIKTAEDFMYKRKLLEHKSSHSIILSSIKATMHEKSHETQEHAERLTYLSKELGKRMKLSQQELDELELVATLHDIGKVGIDDRILNKQDALDDEEWDEMKKHSEIGFRIAMSSPDLVPIADYILSLHERWDGRGYPQGIKEEAIPLLSRIVSVVDAYDAMTEDRAYRKAMSEEAAVEELWKNAGTQFDPTIVKQFLRKVLPNSGTKRND